MKKNTPLHKILRVLVIQSVLVQIVNSNTNNNLKSVETFSESVQYENESIRATRVCARFDRPVYVERSNRLRQLHRVNDVLLDGIAAVRCSSNHVPILYPITQNVSRSIVSLFHGLREKCSPGT